MAGLGRKRSWREEHRERVREQILDATRSLLSQGESFGGLSIEQITSCAGISRSGFYDHCADKRELLMLLLEHASTPILTEANELIGARPSGPSEIPHTIMAAVAFARTNPQTFKAAVAAAGYDPLIASFWRERFLDRFIDAIERLIKSQQQAEAALAIDPHMAATALVQMVCGVLHDHIDRGIEQDDEKLAQTLITITVRTLYGQAG